MPSRRFGWWILTVAWAVQIFWASTDTFEPGRTQAVIARIIELFDPSVSLSTVKTLNAVARKLAHLSEYAILSFLLYRSFVSRPVVNRSAVNKERLPSGWRLAGWCILAATAYSLTDELHQAFVPGRTASLRDCAIDATGAAIAMLLVYRASWTSKTRLQ
jgi:VanZ family protein